MKYIVIFCNILLWTSLHAIDNPHFYRATNLFPEPRIEHNYLTSFDVTLASGSTTKSRNSNHATVPLLDLYGINNIPINQTPTPFSIDGSFNIIEANLFYTQNLAKGFLLLFHVPIRSMHINHLSFINYNNDAQLTFEALIKQLLSDYGINTNASHEAGFGDFSTLVGWTHNYQNTKTIDFIDGTITTGVLAPTGKKKNQHKLFSLPLGYDGHWGFPIGGKLSLGAYEWITIGTYANALFFLKNNQCIQLKTTPEASGIIKLGFGNVTINKGTIWDTGFYFKADHFIYGLSFIAAYSYAGEQKDELKSEHPIELDSAIINSDPMLKGWKMHTFHCALDYDFAKENSKVGTRIGIFYNRQIGGTRVFKTNMGGGSFGLDIAWDL